VKLPERGWRSWGLSAAIAAPVLVLMLMLFRAPPARPRPPAPAKPAPVGLARLGEDGAGSLLKEEATFGDPTPLFLPTPWNATENALPAEARREPGRAFPNYEPKLRFAEAGIDLHLPAVVRIPDVPADAFLSDKPGRPFLGFGQTDRRVKALAARGAFVEITAAGDGVRLLAEPLPEAKPPGEGSWQPLEFLVAIDAGGIVRPPVLTESSRVAEVDDYFESYLRTGLRIGSRLRPGFYRICIGP
jgi:hypothetical protein